MRKFLKLLSVIFSIGVLYSENYFFGNPNFPVTFFIIHLLISIVVYAFLEYIIDLKIKK